MAAGLSPASADVAAKATCKLAPLDGTVVVLSGGNIDPALHARIIAAAA